MDIMLDAVCSTAPTIRINGEDMPQQVVKSRFLKLNIGDSNPGPSGYEPDALTN